MTPSDWYNSKDDPFNTSDDNSPYSFDSEDDFSFGQPRQSSSDPFAQSKSPTFSRFGNDFSQDAVSQSGDDASGWDSQWGNSSWGAASEASQNADWDTGGNSDWGSASGLGTFSGKRKKRRQSTGLLLILPALAAVLVLLLTLPGHDGPQPPLLPVQPTAATEEIIQNIVPTQPVTPPPPVTVPPSTVPEAPTDPAIPDVTEPVYVEPPLMQPLNNVTYYCRGLLNPAQQKLYDQLYFTVARMSEEKIPVQATEEDLNLVTSFVAIDHPELYWFSGCCTYYYSTEEDGTRTYTDIVPIYDFTRDQVLADLPIIEAYAEDCLRGLEHLGEFEQVKAVYEYIINNTFYDLDYYGQSIHEIITKHRGVCASYAETTQFLLQRLGFECFVVSGGDHAWNIVKVEGDYYQLDTTWGDPVVDRIEDSVLGYNYFLVTSQEMYRDHTLESTFPVPNCTATACNYYVREGLYFDIYDEARFLDLMYRDASVGRSTTLRCGNRQVYDTFLSILADGGKIYPLLEQLNVSNLRTDALSYSSDDSYLIVTINFQFQ